MPRLRELKHVNNHWLLNNLQVLIWLEFLSLSLIPDTYHPQQNYGLFVEDDSFQ